MTRPEPPAGWYPDPHNAHQQRYWNGANWTEQARPTLEAASPPSVTTPLMAPPTKRWSGWLKRHKVIAVVVGVVVLAAAGGAVAASTSGNDKKISGSAASALTSIETPSAPTEVTLPSPNPQARYTSSCDYLLGDFSSYTRSGFRFIARATVRNTGNIGERVLVRASWVQVGSRDVTRSRTVMVEWSKSRVVNFSVPVGQSNIDEIQADNGLNDCHVKATIVSTFGVAYPND